MLAAWDPRLAGRPSVSGRLAFAHLGVPGLVQFLQRTSAASPLAPWKLPPVLPLVRVQRTSPARAAERFPPGGQRLRAAGGSGPCAQRVLEERE